MHKEEVGIISMKNIIKGCFHKSATKSTTLGLLMPLLRRGYVFVALVHLN